MADILVVMARHKFVQDLVLGVEIIARTSLRTLRSSTSTEKRSTGDVSHQKALRARRVLRYDLIKLDERKGSVDDIARPHAP